MYKKLKHLALFSLLMFLSACNTSIIEAELAQEVALKNNCSSTQVDRLAINETETALIQQCYSNGILVDLQIAKVSRNADDVLGILDLSDESSSIPSQKYINLGAIENFPIVDISQAATGGGTPSTACVCAGDLTNEENIGTCMRRQLGKYTTCYSPGCSKCSLFLIFNQTNGETEELYNTSIIILPHLFTN